MRRVAKYIVVAGFSALAGAIAALGRKLYELDPHVVRGSRFGFGLVVTLPPDPEEGLYEPLRVLLVNSTVQSATWLGERRMEAPFAYLKAFDLVFEGEQPAQRVALLGGGCFAWPKHALTRHDELEMDVVEADPAVVDAARRWFYLDELEEAVGERLYIHTCDAQEFLEQAACYDTIVNDLFEGATSNAAFATEEGLALVRAHLEPDGLYLVNVVCPKDSAQPLQQLCDLLKTFFAHVWIVPATDEVLSDDDNYVVVATDSDFVPAGGFEA